MFANLTLERPLVVLDIEATGLDVEQDRIVEIGLVKCFPDPHRRTILSERINPGIPIPAGATAIHGISDEEIADCPSFSDLAPVFDEFLNGSDLAGFNLIRFDLKILSAEFARCGGPSFSLEGRKIVDVQTIFHRQEPRDLKSAVKFYLGREHVGAHGAGADTLATADVLDAQLARYLELPRTVAALHDFHRDPRALDLEGLFLRGEEEGTVLLAHGKHKGKLLHEVAAMDPRYLKWLAYHSTYFADTKTIAQAELDRDPEISYGRRVTWID
jgi:DNA polymerase III subunit epsilon